MNEYIHQIRKGTILNKKRAVGKRKGEKKKEQKLIQTIINEAVDCGCDKKCNTCTCK